MIRNNHIRIIFGLLLLLAIALTVSAQEQRNDILTEDVYEMSILENGDEANAVFHHADEARLFGFNGSSGDNVTIEMTQNPNSSLDPYIILLSADGNVLASDDDSGQVSHAAQIRNFPLPEDGTYLILATTWGGRRAQLNDDDESSGEQQYRVSVRGNRRPRDLEEGEFRIFTTFMDIGDQNILELDRDHPVAFVTTELLEDDVISLDVRPEERGLDTLVYLFNPFGERLEVNDDRDSGDLSSLIEDFEVEEDGIYLIFVTVYDFTNAPVDDINLGEVELRID